MNSFLAVISVLHGTIEIQSGPMTRADCLQDLRPQMEIVLQDDDPTNDATCASPEWLALMAAEGWEVIQL